MNSQLNNQKRHHLYTVILTLILCAVFYLTSICSLTPTASALDYNKEILIKSDFADKDLTDSSFTKANLKQSNFSQSNLRGVSFFAANLESVDFTGADLTGATLDSARLVNANLTNAVLEGAFAVSAKFTGAIIDGADFTDILMRDDEQKKLCLAAQGTNSVTGRNTRDTLMCP